MNTKKITVVLATIRPLVIISFIALIESANSFKRPNPVIENGNIKEGKDNKEIEDISSSGNFKESRNLDENENIKEGVDAEKTASEEKKLSEENIVSKNQNNRTNECDGISNLGEYKLLHLENIFEQIHKIAKNKMEENKEDYKEIKNDNFLEMKKFRDKIEPIIYQDKKHFDSDLVKSFTSLIKNRPRYDRVFFAVLNEKKYTFNIYCKYQIFRLNDMHFCPYIAVIDDDLEKFFSVIHDKSGKIFGFIIVTINSFVSKY